MNPGPYQADFPYLSTVLNGLATSTSPVRAGRLLRMVESLASIDGDQATVRTRYDDTHDNDDHIRKMTQRW